MKYAFIYPGQGSQSKDMGRSFFDCELSKEILRDFKEVLKLDFIQDVLETDNLQKTEYTQPAIFLVSFLAQKLFELESNIVPEFVFGHSLGEVSAYLINSELSFKDSIDIIHKRGQFMKEACSNLDVGMMVVLGMNENTLKEICLKAEDKKVYVANFNLKNQTVLAGIKDDLNNMIPILKEAGAKKTIFLNMNVISHCPILQKATSKFHDVLQSKILDTKFNVISNVNNELYKTKELALKNLSDQLIHPVRYYENVEIAIKLGTTCFIEFGNGSVLNGLNAKIINEFNSESNIKMININNMKNLKDSLKLLNS